jgi:hypothetical protein
MLQDSEWLKLEVSLFKIIFSNFYCFVKKDTENDANFTLTNADEAVLKIHTLDCWIKDVTKN